MSASAMQGSHDDTNLSLSINLGNKNVIDMN